MPIVAPASDATGAFEQLISPAGMGQVLYPPAPFPTPIPPTIAGSGNWLSGLLFNDGYRNITIGLTSTQAGALNVTMYLDLAGTIARPVVTTSIVANTALIVDIPPAPTSTTPGPYQAPFASFTVQITNTSGSTAVVSGFQLILSAG